MKEKLRKIWVEGIDDKTMFILSLVIFVLVIIPIFILATYAVPFYDDYSYGNSVKHHYDIYGLKGIIPGMRFTVMEFWYSWQGTYSSIAMMSLSPMVFGEQYYFIGVYVVLATFLFGVYFLISTIVSKVFKGNFFQSGIIALISAMVCIEFVKDPQQGMFWYNSAVHYTFMHGMMFILLGVAIRLIYSEKIGTRIILGFLTTILAIVCAGSNYVTNLQGLLALIAFMVFAAIKKNKSVYHFIAPLIAYSAGFYMNISAPGNNVRGSNFEGMGALQSVFISFKLGFVMIPKLTGIATIVIIAILIPVAVKTINKSGFNFKYPGIVLLLSFCFYCTGYTSSLYSMGTTPVERTMVVVKITYQILLILNVLYMTGWICKKVHSESNKCNFRFGIWYYAVLVLLIITCFMFNNNKVMNYTTYGSFYYLKSGIAKQCKTECYDRINMIKNSESMEVTVPAIKVRAEYLIGQNELSIDKNEEPNKFMARYYYKEAIYLDAE